MKTHTKPLAVLAMSTLVAATIVADARRAEAITVPDLSSTCSTSNGNNGCFKITNNFNFASPTGQSNSAVGTAITSVATGAGTAVKGFTSGTGTGVLGASTSSATGVSGVSTSNGTGVNGSSSTGMGVSGIATSTSGSGNGVQGTTNSSGVGVRGISTATGSGPVPLASTTAAGVYGSSARGYGVAGVTTGGGLNLGGVLGYTNQPHSHGIVGVYQGGDNQVSAIFGKSIRPGGAENDWDPTAWGVEGASGGNGVVGQSFGNVLEPTAGHGQGVYGRSDFGVGVYGESFATTGGDVFSGIGVSGYSRATFSAFGVLGTIVPETDAGSAGVRGDAQGGPGIGVWGTSGSGTAIYGVSTFGSAGWLESTTGPGVRAVNRQFRHRHTRRGGGHCHAG
jgi:hypothetical protein